jgi:hypothetical protein
MGRDAAGRRGSSRASSVSLPNRIRQTTFLASKYFSQHNQSGNACLRIRQGYYPDDVIRRLGTLDEAFNPACLNNLRAPRKIERARASQIMRRNLTRCSRTSSRGM